MIKIKVFFAVVLMNSIVSGQTGLLTVAEKSGYESTSRYSDVMAFI